jgi:hypothetical protein
MRQKTFADLQAELAAALQGVDELQGRRPAPGHAPPIADGAGDGDAGGEGEGEGGGGYDMVPAYDGAAAHDDHVLGPPAQEAEVPAWEGGGEAGDAGLYSGRGAGPPGPASARDPGAAGAGEGGGMPSTDDGAPPPPQRQAPPSKGFLGALLRSRSPSPARAPGAGGPGGPGRLSPSRAFAESIRGLSPPKLRAPRLFSRKPAPAPAPAADAPAADAGKGDGEGQGEGMRGAAEAPRPDPPHAADAPGNNQEDGEGRVPTPV